MYFQNHNFSKGQKTKYFVFQSYLTNVSLYSFLLIATMKTNFHWSLEIHEKNSWNEIGYYENPRPMELVVNFGTNIDEKIREMKSDTMKIHDQ